MKRIGGFVLHTILLLGFLLWTVQAIFTIKGWLFRMELVALLGLLMLALLGMVQYAQGNDAQVRVVYAIGLANILALSLVKWQFFIVPLVASIIGLFASFARDDEPAHDVRVRKVTAPTVTEIKTEKAEMPQNVAPKRKRGRPRKNK